MEQTDRPITKHCAERTLSWQSKQAQISCSRFIEHQNTSHPRHPNYTPTEGITQHHELSDAFPEQDHYHKVTASEQCPIASRLTESWKQKIASEAMYPWSDDTTHLSLKGLPRKTTAPDRVPLADHVTQAWVSKTFKQRAGEDLWRPLADSDFVHTPNGQHFVYDTSCHSKRHFSES